MKTTTRITATILTIALAGALTACATTAPETTPTVPVTTDTPTLEPTKAPEPEPTVTPEPEITPVPGESIKEAKKIGEAPKGNTVEDLEKHNANLKDIATEVESETGRRVVFVRKSGNYNAEYVLTSTYYSISMFWVELRTCGAIQEETAAAAKQAAEKCVASMPDPSLYEIVDLTR